MILIDVYRQKNGHITECTIDGHAGYDEPGYDIVCAAISAISCTAVLGMQQVAGVSNHYENKSGYCSIRPEKYEEEKIQTILETMLIGFTEISRQYSSYVKVNVNRR